MSWCLAHRLPRGIHVKTLEELGVKTRRSFITESTSSELEDFEISATTKKTTQLTMTLPSPAPIAASFSTESLAHKIVKIWKSEVQTGDAEFDEAVYISTETPEATAHMLQSEELRTLLRGLLRHGPITVSGTTVTLTIEGHLEAKAEDENVVRFLNAILR
jgi:hypothetical protein